MDMADPAVGSSTESGSNFVRGSYIVIGIALGGMVTPESSAVPLVAYKFVVVEGKVVPVGVAGIVAKNLPPALPESPAAAKSVQVPQVVVYTVVGQPNPDQQG